MIKFLITEELLRLRPAVEILPIVHFRYALITCNGDRRHRLRKNSIRREAGFQPPHNARKIKIGFSRGGLFPRTPPKSRVSLRGLFISGVRLSRSSARNQTSSA